MILKLYPIEEYIAIGGDPEHDWCSCACGPVCVLHDIWHEEA